MIIFYRIPSESPNIRKITLMLHETGLPFVVKTLQAHEQESWDEHFKRISPAGTFPAIMDTDTGAHLFESAAILHYLAEKSGKLLPREENKRAQTMQWLLFEASNICPTMVELHHQLMHDMGDTPEAVFQRQRDKLAHYCEILNQQLAEQEFLAGDYSIADLIIYPWTSALEDMAELELKDYPHLKRWMTTIDARYNGQETTTPAQGHREWCYNPDGGVEFCRS